MLMYLLSPFIPPELLACEVVLPTNTNYCDKMLDCKGSDTISVYSDF